MTIRIIIILIVALFDLVLALVIYKKNKAKTKSLMYFSLFCLFAFLWSICVAGTLIITNIHLFLWITKLLYFFVACVFITFVFFSFEYPYKIKKLSKLLITIITIFSVIIFYLIFFNKLFTDAKYFSFALHETPNNNILLIYGIYLIFLLICSYYILIKKYLFSEGINKTRILIVILGTLVPFILGMVFDWYISYLYRYDLDRTGPFFAVIMNLSIAYLLFKKE